MSGSNTKIMPGKILSEFTANGSARSEPPVISKEFVVSKPLTCNKDEGFVVPMPIFVPLLYNKLSVAQFVRYKIMFVR